MAVNRSPMQINSFRIQNAQHPYIIILKWKPENKLSQTLSQFHSEKKFSPCI